MRHKDQPTAAAALEAWKRLRAKVEAAGGENYEKPVLVQFLDANTFEVMDRDIVEDEFYVLRKYRIVRELDAAGKDLEDAIRQSGGERRSAAPGRRRGEGRGRAGKPKPESQKGEKRSGQKRRKRRPRRAGPKKDKPPTA